MRESLGAQDTARACRPQPVTLCDAPANVATRSACELDEPHVRRRLTGDTSRSSRGCRGAVANRRHGHLLSGDDAHLARFNERPPSRGFEGTLVGPAPGVGVETRVWRVAGRSAPCSRAPAFPTSRTWSGRSGAIAWPGSQPALRGSSQLGPARRSDTVVRCPLTSSSQAGTRPNTLRAASVPWALRLAMRRALSPLVSDLIRSGGGTQTGRRGASLPARSQPPVADVDTVIG